MTDFVKFRRGPSTHDIYTWHANTLPISGTDEKPSNQRCRMVGRIVDLFVSPRLLLALTLAREAPERMATLKLASGYTPGTRLRSNVNISLL